jgi:hypothetical protein
MNTPSAPLALKFFSFPKIGMRFHTSVWLAILLLVPVAPIAHGADIISNGPVSTVKGSDAIEPRPGDQGSGGQYNYLFYVLPGEGEAAERGRSNRHQLPDQPFFIAYENSARPVQSSDWWTGVGLQWYVSQLDQGWAGSYNDGVIRTQAFLSEPFYYQFVDFDGRNHGSDPPLPPPHGFRLWNQNAIAVKTDGKDPEHPNAPFDARFNIVDRAFLAPEIQAVVTVGLENVHPIGTTKPTRSPWTNVRVRKHTDWGVVLAYTDNGNQMEITMANGSPCTWLERTQGQANFLVWTGGAFDAGTPPTVWQNENGVLGLTINTPFNPDSNIPQIVSKAAYLVIADQGTWTRTDANDGKQALFRNSMATKVVVLAMPNNLRLDSRILKRAAQDLKPFACQKIVNTQIDYPPIPGSQTSVNINGETVQLGYSPTDHRVALQLRVETQPFLPGDCPDTAKCRLLFPHHVKSLHPGQRENLDGRYIWHSIMGPLTFYKGSSFVELVPTNGLLPFFPNQAVGSPDLRNPLPPSQLAVDDIYEAMRTWFYLQEPDPSANWNSFVRSIGVYDNPQFQTYQQGLSSLIESLMIADQLARSPALTGDDMSTNNVNACLCKPKTQVAAEMRDYILQTLKELVGQWADVYTAQFMQYNPTFNTTYGFPAGYGAVQNLNDHHFHYGYFLRAAAAIGRYDRPWLDQYLPIFDQLRKDVANYDRNDVTYPFLRNFSPFYGHSWANGTSLGGADQESTSEATNFSAGLIELGLLLGNNEWRDIGIYMYEQEILATEQYWFNQDATLDDVVPRPPIDPNNVTYNGNWPNQFVTYRGPDGRVWHTTIVGILDQRFLKRETFFGGADSNYFIHVLPMSANTLYVGKNQDWLRATWQQYLLDTGGANFNGATETFIAALQARLPASGQGITGTGLAAALQRLARVHTFKFFGTNAMAKYWAYTNAALGQVDASIVADNPAYGVFKDASTSESHYVAYNPTNQSITATFRNRDTNNVVATFPVGAQSIVSKSSGGSTVTFTPSQITPPASRLYLGPTTGPTPLPMIGQLSSTPGTWLPTNGTFPYPMDSREIDRILPSLSIVPIATGICSDQDLPGNPSGPNGGDPNCRQSNKAYAEWTSTFSGNLVGSRPFTQMTIYTDPAVHIGWEQDPSMRSNTHARVEYYFTDPPHPNPDRVEVLTLASPPGNTFVMEKNKMTPYYAGCYATFPDPSVCNGNQSGLYGLANIPALAFEKVTLDNRFEVPNCDPTSSDCYRGAAPFPSSVTCGTIKVQVYGQAGADHTVKKPIPVSVGTSPLLNRASWIQPPYDGGSCPP